MRSSIKLYAAAALFAVAYAVPAAAQEDPNLTGLVPARDAAAPGEENFGAFGSGSQDTWILAPEFTGKLTPGGPDLAYSTFHYYNAPGVNNQRYFAPIPLPSGAVIQTIQCFVGDSSAVNNVTLGYQVYTHNIVTNAPGNPFFLTWSSAAATGYQQPSINLTPAEGLIKYNQGDLRFNYFLAADRSADTTLRGCRIQWVRTVSPAPAVATFPNDVPTTHPIFRFVEAMAASGLTGGCAAGSFCPDSAVTRGQLAVFLSVALGLHFPN
jgi:hypothetical protein